MAKQTIGIGTVANDGTGDPIRTAFDKANDNFDELYAADAALDTRVDTLESTGGVATLDAVGDVNAPTPGDGEALIWDDGAGEWVAAPLPGGGVGGTVPDGGTAGQVLTKASGVDQDVEWAASGGWTLVDSWTHSVNVTDISFTGLAGVNEIIVLFSNVAMSSSGIFRVQVSTDNGATYYNTLGDYETIDTAGLPATSSSFMASGTNATAARTRWCHILNFGMSGAPKIADVAGTSSATGLGKHIFRGSLDALNAVNCQANAGAFSGGTIYVLGR